METRNIGRMGQYAGFVTRATALIMDIVIIMVTIAVVNALIALPIEYFLRVDPLTCTRDNGAPRAMALALCKSVNVMWVAVALLTGPLYFISLFTLSGQTIGKYVMGVRVVRLDGRPMAVTTSCIRWLGYFVSLLTLGLGFVWVIIDERRQGFHDRMAGTSVIYAWRATSNELMLGRLRKYFGGRPQIAAATTSLASAMRDRQPLEIVATAIPTTVASSALLNMVRDMVTRGTIEVIATAVVAKSANGQIGNISISDLATADAQPRALGDDLQLSPSQKSAIAHDLPADSFIVVVLLAEHWADVLVKQVSRQSAALVRRYELDPNTPSIATTSPL